MGLSGAPLYATLGVGSCAVAVLLALGVVAVKFLLRRPSAVEEEMLFVEHLQHMAQQDARPNPDDSGSASYAPPENQTYEPPVNPLENMTMPSDDTQPPR